MNSSSGFESLPQNSSLELDESPEPIGRHQLEQHEFIADETSRFHKVADTFGRLLSNAGKALRTDLDAAEICLAQASVLLQAERRRQCLQPTPSVGVSLARGGLAPWQIRRVIAHIDSHLAERIKVSDFRELTGLSGSHFSRAFRTSCGDSPHNFVIRRRIENAQKLMLETSERSAKSHCGAACVTKHICLVYFARLWA